MVQVTPWSIRCSWSIACRRCSNCIFILYLTHGFNIMNKDDCKTRREAFKFWDLVFYIGDLTVTLIYVLSLYGINRPKRVKPYIFCSTADIDSVAYLIPNHPSFIHLSIFFSNWIYKLPDQLVADISDMRLARSQQCWSKICFILIM